MERDSAQSDSRDGSNEVIGWNPARVSRLWAYHLDCFPCRYGLEGRQATKLIDDWVRGPNRRPVWARFTIGLRTRERIAWRGGSPQRPSHRRARAPANIVHQVDALGAQLEHRPHANKLVEGAITLFWLGCGLLTVEFEDKLRLDWRIDLAEGIWEEPCGYSS